MSEKMSVLHCVPGLPLRDGGPSRSVVGLTDHLGFEDGISITLVTHAVTGLENFESSNKRVRRKEVEVAESLALKLGLVDRKLIKEAMSSDSYDLLHLHSVWHPSNHWATKFAWSKSVPIVIQPRGMLESWALKHKRLKKRMALISYQARDLRRASAFIATSSMEARSIRALGLPQPIAVIPNGVDFPEFVQSLPSLKDGARGEKILLFLSRVHPKKGVIKLLHAWKKANMSGWRLVLAGPGETQYLDELLKTIRQLKIEASVTYVGELNGKPKAEMFASADLFVLPSFSENFGIVVAEALAHGIPVITTNATPWAELMNYQCGWVIDSDLEALAFTLRQAMSMSDEIRYEMGQRGRKFVQQFNWPATVEKTMAYYRWLLTRGEKPDFVIC